MHAKLDPFKNDSKLNFIINLLSHNRIH